MNTSTVSTAGEAPARTGPEITKRKRMQFVRNTARNFGVAGELFSFFWRNKRWWMLPMIITLVILGILIILGQSSAIAPFIYTLF